MDQLLGFPDIEALVVQLYNTELTAREPGVQASTRVPDPRPAEFIRVIRFGGPRESLISENAQIIVEAWATTEARAAALLNLARAILNAQDGQLFGCTEISGPNNLPDPTTSEVRYTQNFGIRSRAIVLE